MNTRTPYTNSLSSLSPADVHQVDMDYRADWGEVDVNNPSYIAGKPAIPAAQIQADWNQTNNTKADYIKNKPTIPDAQIQADWNQATNTEKDFIKNKPTIPTIPSAPAAGESDATYVLKVDTEGVASWVAAE